MIYIKILCNLVERVKHIRENEKIEYLLSRFGISTINLFYKFVFFPLPSYLMIFSRDVVNTKTIRDIKLFP